MPLLADLFGMQTPMPAQAPPVDDADLLRRAIQLNRGIEVAPVALAAPQEAAPREYPVFAPPPAEHIPTAAAATVSPPPAAPQAASAMSGPSLGERLGKFLMAGGEGSLARGIGEATYGADRSKETENLTAKLLMERSGLPMDHAMAVARNPSAMNQILPQIFGPKEPFIKLGPEEALFNKNTGSMAARNDTAKTPAPVQEYKAYFQDEINNNRIPKGLNDWDLERRRAAATAVSINDKRENTFQSEAGKVQAKRFGELIEAGSNAKTMIGQLQQLSEIAKNVQTGPQAQLTATFGPWAQALGLKIDGLSDIEAYKSITDRLAPQMRAPGSGATSDYDAKQFLSSLPNIGRTSGGNELVNRTLQLLSASQLRAGEIASKVYAGEITPTDGERQIRELPDPYADFKSWDAARRESSQAHPWRDPDSGAVVRRKQ